jgi:deazaflavin-dependent oxidoreductase (nitroreductase family)
MTHETRRGSVERWLENHLMVGSRSRRWMYRGGHPNAVAGILNRATVAFVSAGLSPKRLVVLEVEGRKTGRRVSMPVVVADLEGKRYLVSMLGERSHWPQNVRAAGGRAVIRHGRRQAVRLEEVPEKARAPVLKRYLELAPGARAHMPVAQEAPLAEFQRVATRYPVFRISSEPLGAPRHNDRDELSETGGSE